MLTEDVARLLLDTFKGRAEYIALQSGTVPFMPVPLTSQVPVERFIVRHSGDDCCGFYVLTADSHVHLVCWDFDNHDGTNPDAHKDARTLAQFLIGKGFPAYMEQSWSGTGAHVWVFFTTGLKAGEARIFANGALNDCELGDQGTEVYPKQSLLTEAKPLGNLIRYPLAKNSCFVAVESGEPVTDVVKYLSEIKRVTPEQVLGHHWWCTAEVQHKESASHYEVTGFPSRVRELLERPEGEVLAKRWMGDVSGMCGDRSNSTLCMAIATELARYCVPTPEIEAALAYWSTINGYDKGLRAGWVEMTVRSAYANLMPAKPTKATYASDRAGVLLHAAIERYVTGGMPSRISWGVKALDDSTGGGYCLGEYTIVAGRPSNGKSALAVHALDAAAMQGYSGAFISLEMTEQQCGKRSLLRLTDLPENEWCLPEVADQLHTLLDTDLKSKAPVFYSFGSNKTASEIEVEVREFAARGCKVVIIDYASLIAQDDSRKSKHEHISACSVRFANLTRELGIALVLVVQLKRPDAKFRKLVLPQLSDLAESGQLERDADNVLAVLWPWKEYPADYDQSVYNVLNLKCKHRGIKEPICIVGWNPVRQLYS